MRDKLRRLERAMQGNLEPIPLRDGSIAYINSEKALQEVFLYFSASLRADYNRSPRPKPPECLEVVAGAKDRHAALDRVMGGTTHLPLDEEALVERGDLVPRQMAPSYTPIEEE